MTGVLSASRRARGESSDVRRDGGEETRATRPYLGEAFSTAARGVVVEECDCPERDDAAGGGGGGGGASPLPPEAVAVAAKSPPSVGSGGGGGGGAPLGSDKCVSSAPSSRRIDSSSARSESTIVHWSWSSMMMAMAEEEGKGRPSGGGLGAAGDGRRTTPRRVLSSREFICVPTEREVNR